MTLRDSFRFNALGLAAALYLAVPAVALATDSASEAARLALIQRQLDTMDRLADASAALPASDRSRYHFDYARLHADIERMRHGIGDYMTPLRAQPRDPSLLAGQYRVEVRTP